jgi:hypothetical protein
LYLAHYLTRISSSAPLEQPMVRRVPFLGQSRCSLAQLLLIQLQIQTQYY